MTLTPERIEEIRKRLEGITPFPWMAGHLADDTSSCNCTSVLSESYAGAVCTVEPNNGKRISDGGNDGAPLEEAKANLRFLAHAPQDISDLLSAYDALSRDGMWEAPEGWRLVPDHVTEEWITALDAALVRRFGSTPGGQQIAEGLALFLAAAPQGRERDGSGMREALVKAQAKLAEARNSLTTKSAIRLVEEASDIIDAALSPDAPRQKVE